DASGPSGSLASLPAVAMLANRFAAATLQASAVVPWPLVATLGIQYPRGLLAAESNSVPDCTSVGVLVRLPISYQREAFRPPLVTGVPPLSTCKLCAVHSVSAPVSLLRVISAAHRRVSSASKDNGVTPTVP